MLNHLAQTLYTTRPDGTLTTTTTSTDSAAVLPIFAVVMLVVIFLIIIPLWKLFKKAGKPGWAAIVPVYNLWVLFEITGFPAWISLLSLIPFVNIVPAVLSLVATVKLAQRFGKGIGFGIGMIFLPFIFYPILAYGKAQYSADGAQTGEISSAPAAGTPEGAFDPTKPESPASPAPAAVEPTVGAPEPPAAPTDPAPQSPAGSEPTPPQSPNDTGEPKPPAA